MIKAQFMQLWDGLTTDNESTVLVMGATNRPKDVDKAILRYRGVLFLNFFLYFLVFRIRGPLCAFLTLGSGCFFPSVADPGSRDFFTLVSGIRKDFFRIPNPNPINFRA
jgi:hypothetical protein